MAVFNRENMYRIGLVLVCFTVVTTASARDVDLYLDLPDDYVIEQRMRKLQERQLAQMHRRLGDYGVVDSHVAAPIPDFSYSFSPDVNGGSSFAVAPTDPRYYQDTPLRRYNQDDTGVPELNEEDDDTFQPPRVTVDQPAVQPAQPTARPSPPTRPPTPRPSPAQATLPFVGEFRREEVDKIPVNAQQDNKDHIYFIAIVAGCSAAAVVGVFAIGFSWYKLQRNAKAAADVEYPAYGVTGPHKDASPTGDRKLAQSAQMYHYQHQKQQIIALENRVNNERAGSVSEAESDEDNEEGDYTVYECPGLAPTGEMEVKNPLFLDDPTPATPAATTIQSKGDDGGSSVTK